MKKEVKKSPFFAQLLEKQIEKESVKGGDNNPWKTNTPGADDINGNPTLKYPSDTDEIRYPYPG